MHEENEKGPNDSLAQLKTIRGQTLDLSVLPKSEQQALQLQYAQGFLDIEKKALELHVDAGALRATLDNLTRTTTEVSQSGNAITITHVQTTKLGRTEIIMGNTTEAQKGKLSRSQTGFMDWKPIYIIAGIVALIVIIAITR